MARTTQTRKRSRSNFGGRFAKRRRVFRRRRTGKRTTTFTNQASYGSGALSMFRRKPFSARRFRNEIFKDTMWKPHYRSIRSISFIGSTNGLGLSTVRSDIFMDMPLQPSGSDFFTTAGGAVNVDGAAMPLFTTSGIMIRGGSIWATIMNIEVDIAGEFHAEAMRVKFWFGYTVPRPAVLPSTLFPSQNDNSWDPTIVSDFQSRIGKIYYQTEVLLRNGECFEFKRKLRASKLNYDDFKLQGGNPFIMVQVVNLKHEPTNNSFFSYKSGYNMAFSGDAV